LRLIGHSFALLPGPPPYLHLEDGLSDVRVSDLERLTNPRLCLLTVNGRVDYFENLGSPSHGLFDQFQEEQSPLGVGSLVGVHGQHLACRVGQRCVAIADQGSRAAAWADVRGGGDRLVLLFTDHELMEDQQAPQSAGREAKVITLCGSTKFEAEFAEVNQRLTMEGCVVISLGMFSLPDLPDYDWTADSSDLKGRLGGLHLQKIRMADEVYIVDPGGYAGESTRREIAYAEWLGKPVRYLSREPLARTGDGSQA
jgi:hypothetical protein